MSGETKLEWADSTWNIITGCSKESIGCLNCYALRDWDRLSKQEGSVYFGRKFTDIQFHGERLDQPLRWQRPRKIFVNSMSDLFHHHVPDHVIDKIFAIMYLTKRHTFQILTKRAERMCKYMSAPDLQRRVHDEIINIHSQFPKMLERTYEVRKWPLSNVWLGVSIENQEAADNRMTWIANTNAAVKWISAEPLIGSIDFRFPHKIWGGDRCDHCCTGMRECDDPDHYDRVVCPYCRGTGYAKIVDWVVVGGESGPNSRPSHPKWMMSAVKQCVDADIPVLFKQWGEWGPDPQDGVEKCVVHYNGNIGGNVSEDDDNYTMYLVGKKNSGRLLGTTLYDEYPEVAE